jgi:hypothetical protein
VAGMPVTSSYAPACGAHTYRVARFIDPSSCTCVRWTQGGLIQKGGLAAIVTCRRGREEQGGGLLSLW